MVDERVRGLGDVLDPVRVVNEEEMTLGDQVLEVAEVWQTGGSLEERVSPALPLWWIG